MSSDFSTSEILATGTILCFDVNLLALWNWWQLSHNALLHSTHTHVALVLLSSLSQDIHCFSACCIFPFSNNPTANWFTGSCSTHSFAEQPSFWAWTVVLHTGHLFSFKMFVLMYDSMHASQKVWRHGKYFGTVKISRHIEQYVKSPFSVAILMQNNFCNLKCKVHECSTFIL